LCPSIELSVLSYTINILILCELYSYIAIIYTLLFLSLLIYIFNELCSPECKIKQDDTQCNSTKDKTCQVKDPIRIMEINLLVRNGSFLHILVPCPNKNPSQSFCCNIAHNYFTFQFEFPHALLSNR